MNILTEELEKAGSIAVSGHVRPDGDCVGSCVGLYRYVRENFPEKEICVYLEEIPNVLKFMRGAEDIRHSIPEGKRYDLFVMLDCGDVPRLGFSGPLMEGAVRTVCIDHHVSNQLPADVNYVRPEASSTSELVYDLLDDGRISLETAECLYTGMVHDTGVFRYSCTHPSTLRAAARLMEKGVDFTRIITQTFDEKTYAQNQILGRVLLESFLFLDGHCIVASVSRKVMDFYQVEPKHMEGIVSQLKLTKGVDVAVFMYELQPGTYKVSLRSTEAVDVSKVAAFFGGGGHERASGFTMMGTVHDVINNLTGQIARQLEKEGD